jgi:hypothetical protein
VIELELEVEEGRQAAEEAREECERLAARIRELSEEKGGLERQVLPLMFWMQGVYPPTFCIQDPSRDVAHHGKDYCFGPRSMWDIPVSNLGIFTMFSLVFA